MTEPHACSDATFISSVEGYEVFPHLVRLIARGRPVEMAEIAALSGRTAAEAEKILRAQPGTEWDGDRLVGFGLTLCPTEHRYTVGGRILYTWCATDTLLFTIILGEDAIAESTCPTTDVAIRVEIGPDGVSSVTPPEAVVSQRHGNDHVANLRADVCDHGRLFASPDAASTWAAEHPEGEVLGVAEVFDHCRTACQELGWVVPEPTVR